MIQSGRFIQEIKSQSGSGRFLKKAAPKLLPVWAGGVETSTAQVNKVFLLLFVHKKKSFLSLYSTTGLCAPSMLTVTPVTRAAFCASPRSMPA
jgi:hypothetical protein